MTLTRPLAIAAAVIACSLAIPAASSALTVGIAEQKPAMFSDPLFRDTGITHVRVLVPWDVVATDFALADTDRFLQAAQATGVVPLVTFGRSRVDRRKLPSVREFTSAFRAFRARYPWISEYSTWNEANHYGEPTGRHPARAAGFWRAIRRNCAGCTVLAADMLDFPNMARWARAFQRAAHTRVSAWGLHNYIDANRFQKRSTTALLRATRGQIWLTETGGLVKRSNRSAVKLPESEPHAAQAVRFIFDRLVRTSPRIKRVYLYNWNALPGSQTWDSALVSATGQARPAYDALRSQLARLH